MPYAKRGGREGLGTMQAHMHFYPSFATAVGAVIALEVASAWGNQGRRKEPVEMLAALMQAMPGDPRICAVPWAVSISHDQRDLDEPTSQVKLLLDGHVTLYEGYRVRLVGAVGVIDICPQVAVPLAEPYAIPLE